VRNPVEASLRPPRDAGRSDSGGMTTTPMTLAELFETVPSDLAAYFGQVADGSLSGREELDLNLLRVADAVRWTKDFRDFHPVVSFLRGVILDDPNTSNHHVYLSESCCSGAVFYLNHDGDSQIVFPTLAPFLDAAHRTLETSQRLTAFHPESGVQLADQTGLNNLIAGLLDGEFDCDCDGVVVALVPSLDLTDLALLERLAKDDDFYVAEAVGDAIARRPRIDLAAIAESCQRHPHFQAARAGSRALAAIASLQ
jgi:hypothetical protein